MPWYGHGWELHATVEKGIEETIEQNVRLTMIYAPGVVLMSVRNSVARELNMGNYLLLTVVPPWNTPYHYLSPEVAACYKFTRGGESDREYGIVMLEPLFYGVTRMYIPENNSIIVGCASEFGTVGGERKA